MLMIDDFQESSHCRDTAAALLPQADCLLSVHFLQLGEPHLLRRP